MRNYNKIKYTCSGEAAFAECVNFEGTVSEDSGLFDQNCLSVEQVIEDVYSMIDTINQEIDMSTLGNDCITFTEPKTVSSVVYQMYLKLCALEDTIATQAQTIATMQLEITELQDGNCP